MRISLLFISLIFLMSSCLKKIDGVDELNSNVFDKEYTGGLWFEIDDFYTVLIDGQTRYKMEVLIPKENLPSLKPSFLEVSCNVNEQDFGVVQANLTSDSNFEFFLIVIPDGGTDYCLTMGIYLDDEELTINSFTDCTTL